MRGTSRRHPRMKRWWRHLPVPARTAIILSVLFLLGLVAYGVLRFNFFMYEPLMVELDPPEKTLQLTNNQSTNLTVETRVHNSWFCRASCNVTYRDLSTGRLLHEETVRPNTDFERTVPIRTPSFGRGMRLYRYRLSCSNRAHLLCPSSTEHTKYTFITVQYNLSREHHRAKTHAQQLFNRSRLHLQQVYNITRVSRERLDAFTKAIGMFQASASAFRTDLSSLQEQFNAGLVNVLDIREAWREKRYPRVSSQLQSSLDTLRNLSRDAAGYEERLDSFIAGYNTLVKNISRMRNDSTLYEAHLFFKTHHKYYNTSAYVKSKNILDALAVMHNTTFYANRTLSQSRTFLRNLSSRTKNLTQLYDERKERSVVEGVSLYNRHIHWFNHSEPLVSNISNSSFPLLCERLSNLSSAVEAHNARVSSRRGNIANFSLNMTLDSLASDNETVEQQLQNLTLREVRAGMRDASEAPSTDIPEGYSWAKPYLYLNLSSNYTRHTDFVCDLANTTPHYTSPPLQLSLFNATPPGFELDLSLGANPPQCCQGGNCRPCCDTGCHDNSSLYPVLFVHGHLFSVRSSPQHSLLSLSPIMEQLDEEGFINTGSFDPTRDFEYGEWSPLPYPMLTRVSYYYYSYTDLGVGTLQVRKTERMENYAIRLNEYIDKILQRTGRDKVKLVAYSMGGLVARRYMDIFGSEKVDTLVTVGTPHHGINPGVRRICGLSGSELECREMEKGSVFLKRLNQDVADTDLHTVGGVGCDMANGTGDGVVAYTDAILEEARTYRIKGNCTGLAGFHTQLMDPGKHPEVLSIVHGALR